MEATLFLLILKPLDVNFVQKCQTCQIIQEKLECVQITSEKLCVNLREKEDWKISLRHSCNLFYQLLRKV